METVKAVLHAYDTGANNYVPVLLAPAEIAPEGTASFVTRSVLNVLNEDTGGIELVKVASAEVPPTSTSASFVTRSVMCAYNNDNSAIELVQVDAVQFAPQANSASFITRSVPYVFNGLSYEVQEVGTVQTAPVAADQSSITRAVPYVFNGLSYEVQEVGTVQTAPVAADQSIITRAVPYAFNGATLDRVYNNRSIEVLASAARIASVNSADVINYNGLGGHVIVNVTAIVGAPSVVVTVQGKDEVSGQYYDLLISTAISTVGINVLKIHPGIVAAANGAAADILPRVFRVSVANANADSITYSVSANLVA